MEFYKRICIIAVILLSAGEMLAANQSCDFKGALEEIKKYPGGSINYTTFCIKQERGEDKIACRIKNVRSVGFLVCQKPVYEDSTPCSEIIDTELNNSLTLQRKYQLKTVEVYDDPISNVKCGLTNNVTCSAFLECWVDENQGKFEQIRDHIVNGSGSIKALINDVKEITTSQKLTTTIADLKKIVAFMEPTLTGGTYKQICDLQGFFLISGGFLVADTPVIEENIGINDTCYDNEPTTRQVLDGLNEIIKGLSSSSVANPTIQSSYYCFIFIIIIHFF